MRRWAVRGVLTLVVVLATAAGVSYELFNRPRQDAVAKVDAIVVLGGEHDGREQYAFALASAGIAHTVFLSDPYPQDDPLAAAYCNHSAPDVEVVCRAPVPSTTRGEAIAAREEASARGWRRIMVITWGFHLPRARYVFDQCFSSARNSAIFRAVPRQYDYSPLRWAYTYLYQYVGLVKAAAMGPCPDSG